MKYVFFILLFPLLLISNAANAQFKGLPTDTTTANKTSLQSNLPKDSIPSSKKNLKYDPSKSLLWSLIPGGGQIYNQQYFKAPIYIGGITGLGILAIQKRIEYRKNYDQYIDYLDESSTLVDPGVLADLRLKKQRNLRHFHYATNAAIFLYGFSIVDAFLNTQIKNDNHPNSPVKAAYFSAILPGLGQALNKRYWKIPIVYAGFGVSGYFIYFYGTRVKQFTQEYLARNRPGYGERDPNMNRFNTNTLLTNRRIALKSLHTAVFAATGWYLLNIIDALIDAHLYDFDISDDLSLRLEPKFDPRGNGLSLKMTF